MILYTLCASAFLSLALAQAPDLPTALQTYPQVSQFSDFLKSPAGAGLLPTADSGTKYTVLVPTNGALDKFTTKHGSALTALPADKLKAYLQYHVLVAPVTKSNFSQAGGLTVPTLLTDTQYNNRSAGADLTSLFGASAGGQVLYFSKDSIASGSKKFRVMTRQDAGGDAQVRAGLAEVTTVTAIDGEWGGGRFQIVDDVLEPPQPCSNTIRGIGQLLSLDNALNRSGLWPTLDRSPNVTCLAPNTAAFKAAGNADSALSQGDLIKALEFHTLPMPLYSNFIKDGMTIKSLANLTVKVAVNSSGTYFNDAKVIAQNVLTNNGLIHILDKVMSPMNNTAGSSTSSSSPTSTSTSAPGSTTSKGAAAGAVTGDMRIGLALTGFIFALFW